MQAVILAAGKATRMRPLTLDTPKPLLKIGEKTILEHNLDQLISLVDEVVLVIGYKGDDIKARFGSDYKGMKLVYVEQKEQLGTGHALQQTKSVVNDRFLVLMGDDLYDKEDIKACLDYDYAVLVQKVEDPTRFGVFVTENNIVKDFVEKPKEFVSDLANLGVYVLDTKIFDELEKIEKTERNEYELTSAVLALSKKVALHCVLAKKWIPIAYPEDLEKARKLLS
ncbi:MAG: sugar phosphate nucleotidyltransferase [Candidatus Aenigmatarchaeota archaeon]